MRLHPLLRRAGVAFDAGRVADFEVRGLTQDSRRCTTDSVFVALSGGRRDGRSFIEEAVRNGARFVLTEAETGRGIRSAYARLCREFWGDPGAGMTLVGVTGTNGKTTSAYAIRHIAFGEKNAGILGTVRYEFGDYSIPAPHTTPDPEGLYAALREMERRGCRAVVMEASSHALDQDRLEGLAFDAALFTNLTRDHLDYHKTMENYFEAKSKLFSMLRAGGTAVLNADDPLFSVLRSRVRKSLSYGIQQDADLVPRDIRMDLDGTSFVLQAFGRRIPVRSGLIGAHNLYNLLGALGVASVLGSDLAEAAERAASFKAPPGRLERVEAGQDFHVFVDYAHTDDGLRSVLAALRPFAKGDLLVLFGCGGERDSGKRSKMARVAEGFADWVLLTSDNPRHENPKTILKEIEEGFSGTFRSWAVQPDRRRAIRTILLRARPHDVVLLAGKGHEDIQVIGDEKVPFSDRDEAMKVLEGR